MRNRVGPNFTGSEAQQLWDTIYDQVIYDYIHGKLRLELIEWGREKLQCSENLSDDEILKKVEENLDINDFIYDEANRRFFYDPWEDYEDPFWRL